MALSLSGGRICFNQGAFWDAHEQWEEVWKTAEGDEKLWIQGLIQLAAALVNKEITKDRSAVILGRKAGEKLAGAPSVLHGIDIDAARRVCALLAADRYIDLASLRL